MRKAMTCLVFVLAMVTAPLAASDYRNSDQQIAPGGDLFKAVVTWVLGLVPSQVERTSDDVSQKFGSDVTVDGSAAPVDNPSIDNDPTPIGSHRTVDG